MSIENLLVLRFNIFFSESRMKLTKIKLRMQISIGKVLKKVWECLTFQIILVILLFWGGGCFNFISLQICSNYKFKFITDLQKIQKILRWFAEWLRNFYDKWGEGNVTDKRNYRGWSPTVLKAPKWGIKRSIGKFLNQFGVNILVKNWQWFQETG